MTAANVRDTTPRPHATLGEQAVEALLSAVRARDAAALDALGSPAAAELTLTAGWHTALHPLQAPAADYALAWREYNLLLVAAIETGALALPDGTDVDLEEMEPGLARLLVRPAEPLAVTLATDPYIPADVPAGAASAELALLTDATWRIGSALTRLYDAALPLLADYSTNPNLLAAIADTDDSGLRAAALRNPHTPEHARVMAALRTAD